MFSLSETVYKFIFSLLVFLYTSIQEGTGDHLKGFYPEKRLSKSSIGQRVAADLRMRIISKDLVNGTVLSENKLSEEYNVSRSPIREALRVLEREDLVQLNRMGAKVVGITERDIDEIYDVRLMMESFVFKHLLEEENNDELVTDLNKLLEMMKIAIKYKDADEFSFRDVEFHETIIKSINHRYLEILWSNIKPVMECLILLDMRHRMEENYDDFTRVIENHKLLIQSIQEKDRDLVEIAFCKNFNDVKKNSDGLWTNPESLKKANDYHHG
ncbi:transcriptional regulator, GntR family [Melghirimyces thermohalophilus]|uniref:Transcriptional regulator, GntR family n=1 Tax=Melghirimyces thermohalophilus TaxID=1236220 RepID=A0A1G6LYY4_9BACL|nr:transcriptional regulator, GntR family [Melghirimyces thermohalophilus]